MGWEYGCDYTQDYADEPCGMICADFGDGEGGVIVDVDDAHESAEPNRLHPCPHCNTEKYLKETAEFWEEAFFGANGRWPNREDAAARRKSVFEKFARPISTEAS